MTTFDKIRRTNEIFHLDVEGLRRGRYSDRYFVNTQEILTQLRRENYAFVGPSRRKLPIDPTGTDVGDIDVEAQIFNRRKPYALVAGIDMALAIVRHAAGHYAEDRFVEGWKELEVVAVQDGDMTYYEGDLSKLQPVMEIRGRYSEFTLLETPMLGVLTRASRIATNVYEVLQAANGKQVLFFPARFDLSEVQSLDGYAYWVAIQRFNQESGYDLSPLVSTDAQAAWWGGAGSGTVPHAVIACFLADTSEMMQAFARYIALDVPRIALVDFDNDSVATSLNVINGFWPHYRTALAAGDETGMKRWTLNGVRLDTAANMLDQSLNPDDPTGVSPVLVQTVRRALDNAWSAWDLPQSLIEVAQSYCENVQIVVSGGFDRAKIERFEHEGAPVDAYGVGSTLLSNDRISRTDFTMDVVRLNVGGQWVDMCKAGRYPCNNINLRPIDLSNL